MPSWQRLYLVGLSAIFLYWANDEYFKLHEFNRYWHIHYAVVGVIILLETLLVAWRAPPRSKIWFAYLLAGLGLTATGTIIIERLPTQIPTHICGDLGFLRFDPCLFTYRLEESFEFLGIWLALVAILGLLSNEVSAPAFRVSHALSLLPVAWLCLFLGPDFAQLYRQSMDLLYPSQMPVNRALWIVLTLWRQQDDEFQRQVIISSDQLQLTDTQIVSGELVFPAKSPATQTTPMAVFDNGIALDAVEMPAIAQPGDRLSITFSWSTEEPGSEDHAQFLHLGNVESGTWWIYDQEPLGTRLPTRLWYSGLADREVWQVPLPVDLVPGRYNVFTGLYRASDRERVPARGADESSFVDARVPLGFVTIEE